MGLAPVRRVRRAEGVARRRRECLGELPTLLDVVTLGLSAGLSFDASLELYCARYQNELARAFSDSATIYYDKAPDQGGKVRLVVVG